MITFWINHKFFYYIKWQIFVKNAHLLPEPNSPTNTLKLKDSSLIIINDKEKKQIITLKKL